MKSNIVIFNYSWLVPRETVLPAESVMISTSFFLVPSFTALEAIASLTLSGFMRSQTLAKAFREATDEVMVDSLYP